MLASTVGAGREQNRISVGSELVVGLCGGDAVNNLLNLLKRHSRVEDVHLWSERE